MHASLLASGELLVARVVAVVHVVVDGVNAGAGAGVAADGASVGGLVLRGRVSNAIVGGAAAALEGVVETEPMTSLVGEGLEDGTAY